MSDKWETGCPWDDPSFHLPLGSPCPVCGCRGGDVDEVEEKCVVGLLGDKRSSQGSQPKPTT